MNPVRITQSYNNSLVEGWCQTPNGQLSGKACLDHSVYYGHTGLDMSPLTGSAGENDITSVYDGLVLASLSMWDAGSWGETLVIATRANSYSEQILTLHYHHLHAYGWDKNYVTTRSFAACDPVTAGEVIAQEGGTMSWPVHLHLEVRLWDNPAQLRTALNSTGALLGPGYIYSNTDALRGRLDPEMLLFRQFRDFNNPKFQVSSDYQSVSKLRDLGIDFGNHLGEFGRDEKITRGDIMRWLKIASLLNSVIPGKPTFTDVPKDSKHSPYVEVLIGWPMSLPVVNRTSTCVEGERMFCPDKELNRAELAKVVVVGLQIDSFLGTYNTDLFNAYLTENYTQINRFEDVSIYQWYFPYIFYANQRGYADHLGAYFNPQDSVTRVEAAQWVVKSLEEYNDDFCDYNPCPIGWNCDRETETCQQNEICTNNCENGGFRPSPTECQCTQGECCDGCQFYGADQLCSTQTVYGCVQSGSGSNPGYKVVERYCSGDSQTCSGVSRQEPWSILEACGADEVCDSSGAQPTCQSAAPGCRFEFYPDNRRSCHDNPDGTGKPELCLELDASHRARICKQGGIFTQSLRYQFLDHNHLDHYLGDFTFPSGSDCTSWQQLDLTYLPQNQPAGLIAEIDSPEDCTSAGCHYYTGYITATYACD